MRQYLFLVILFIDSFNSANAQHMNRSFDSGYAPLGALKMYYEIHGKGGIPLVLLHGGGSTIQTTFGQTLDGFADDRQVIAVELQAHGHTADIGRPTSFEQDADDVAGVLKYLKISKADIFGFSNGGHTALQIGIRHPDVVGKLVIVSAFYQREGAVPGFFDMFPKATIADMPQPYHTAFLAIDPDRNHLQTMFERDKTRMEHFTDFPDAALRSISAKTLIVCGTHDVITPEHAIKMSHMIPGAELLILPGNHGSFLGEIYTAVPGSKMPELTVGLVKDFLDKK